MSRRVLLINPGLPQKRTQLNIPISLLYLGTWLHHQNYDINILDAFNGDIRERLVEELKGEILALGLSVMTPQVSSAIEIAQFIKTLDPDIPIIWGGIHIALYPRQVIESGLVDFVIKDEGEITTTELLEALEDQRDYYAIKGLTFKDYDGKIITNPDREPMDLNKLPCPNLTLLEDVRNIGDIKTVMKQVQKGLPLLTSKGCPHRCTFCINPITRQKYRFRSSELVIQDLQELLNQGISEICFIDEDFFANKPRLIEILDGIDRCSLKFKWFGTARADYFRKGRIDYELLKRLKENGCQQLGIGLESGSQRILDMIKKDITLEDSLNATELLNKIGIDATLSFMVGLPGETAEEIKKTVNLVLKVSGINNNFRILGPQIYRPYAGSELYNECIKLGMKEPKTLEGWIDNPCIGGDIKPKDYGLFPWVQYPMKDLVRLVFYCWMAGLRVKGPGLTTLVRKIGAWRLRHYYFAFPIEMWLLGLLEKLDLVQKLSRGKYH